MIRRNLCPNGPSRTCSDCGPNFYVCSIPKDGTSCCGFLLSSCEDASQPGPQEPRSANETELANCAPNIAAGGWQTILKRYNGVVDFESASWDTYATMGVGQVGAEFFTSLETIHSLTSDGDMELLVEMEEAGETAYAWYGAFSIGNSSTKYQLEVGDYDVGSTAGDGLSNYSGQPFSTIDNDTSASCAARGAFWYGPCFDLNPLGVYGDTTGAGVSYVPFRPLGVSLDRIEFKMRKRRCA